MDNLISTLLTATTKSQQFIDAIGPFRRLIVSLDGSDSSSRVVLQNSDIRITKLNHFLESGDSGQEKQSFLMLYWPISEIKRIGRSQ